MHYQISHDGNTMIQQIKQWDLPFGTGSLQIRLADRICHTRIFISALLFIRVLGLTESTFSILAYANYRSLLYKMINLRDNYLVFSGDFNFNHSDFLTLSN